MAEPHDDWLIFTAASIRNLNRIGIVGMSRADDLVSFVSPRPVGWLIRGEPLSRTHGTIDEQPTQHGRDDLFPDVRIIGCPPMADAVIAVTIFQQHFPGMLAM